MNESERSQTPLPTPKKSTYCMIPCVYIILEDAKIILVIEHRSVVLRDGRWGKADRGKNFKER